MLGDDCLLACDASRWDEAQAHPREEGMLRHWVFWSTHGWAHGCPPELTQRLEFYRCYPHRGYVNPTYATKTRGYFETLKKFIAVAFRKEKTRLLCTDTAHGGILEWPPFAVDLSKKMSSAMPEAKRAELASYMFGCVYGLMLVPQDNMSQSMGFEPLLIVQNKRCLEAAT